MEEPHNWHLARLMEELQAAQWGKIDNAAILAILARVREELSPTIGSPEYVIRRKSFIPKMVSLVRAAVPRCSGILCEALYALRQAAKCQASPYGPLANYAQKVCRGPRNATALPWPKKLHF